jgi:DNA-binding PadR family transcriptional regulator
LSTNLREAVLGLLLDRPNHAYALKRLIAPRVSPSELVNDGVLYPLLAKLESGGLIRGREEISESNRKRTIYTITGKGERHLMTWLESDADEGEEPVYDFFLGNPFLVKVQFFQRLPHDKRSMKLAAQLEKTEQKLRSFAEIRRGMVERKADPFRIALLDLGIAHQKCNRQWLKRQLSSAAP